MTSMRFSPRWNDNMQMNTIPKIQSQIKQWSSQVNEEQQKQRDRWCKSGIIPNNKHWCEHGIIPNNKHWCECGIIPNNKHWCERGIIPKNKHWCESGIIPNNKQWCESGMILNNKHLCESGIIPNNKHWRLESTELCINRDYSTKIVCQTDTNVLNPVITPHLMAASFTSMLQQSNDLKKNK